MKKRCFGFLMFRLLCVSVAKFFMGTMTHAGAQNSNFNAN